MLTFLAQAEAVSAKAIVETADFLSTKDLKWWLAAFVSLGVFAALLTLKWLLASHQSYIESMRTQLTEQRAANAALNEKLIDYIQTDHMKSIEAQNAISSALRELSAAISHRAA